MLGFVNRGTMLKGHCKATEGEGVSFPSSGVLIFSGVCPVTLSVPHRPPGRLYCGLRPALSQPPTNVSTARWAAFTGLCGLLALAGVLAASGLCVPAEHDLSAGSEPSLRSGGEVLLSSLVPSLFAFPQP